MKAASVGREENKKNLTPIQSPPPAYLKSLALCVLLGTRPHTASTDRHLVWSMRFSHAVFHTSMSCHVLFNLGEIVF